MSDADRRRRFVQEAQAASALNHPHIITIYEIESADGNDFIVMEYVRGKSLDALIPRQGMRLNEALRIAIAVADALVTAHARGIVHRDLKPANVIVGTDGTVKVLDFGLAKLIGDADTPEEDSPTLTSQALVSAPGTIAGTAAYMAPEQATGGTIDARTDIFSFGAMLYEMVTGSRAFPGSSTAETLSAVIHAQPRPPSAVVVSDPWRPRESDSPVSPQGSAAAVPAHRRREGGAGGCQGGVRVWRDGACLGRAHPSSRTDRGAGCGCARNRGRNGMAAAAPAPRSGTGTDASCCAHLVDGWGVLSHLLA